MFLTTMRRTASEFRSMSAIFFTRARRNPRRNFEVCMRSLAPLRIMLAVTLLAASFAADASAQQPVPSRITSAVDESVLTALKGNTHPLALAKYDQGAAPDNLPMERMLLVLKRSDAQEFELHGFLDDQQNKKSASYHKWMTPEEFGRQFGPSDSDIETIVGWLQSHAFQVTNVSKGRSVIEFTGTAGQVKQAFHTEIHSYMVNGKQHWANSSDPSIPTALTPVVAGVWSMHNFEKKPMVQLSKEKFSVTPPPVRKIYASDGSGNNALGPGDYAVIYNINPVYTAGIKGNNVTLGVVARSNISTSDLTAFYTLFQLGTTPNVNVVLNGPDPGNLGGNEEIEAALDSTWSSALAPGASTQFVVSATTNTTDGVDLSELYIIENNLADVMTESFGSCEQAIGTTGLKGVSALAEQAAAQGISYMLSTGDSGAAGCDSPSAPSAGNGYAVSGLASTPFDTAVGGTEFNENGNASKYWNEAASILTTALSYIPEDVWNESCISGCGAPLLAGGGGASIFFGKPSWQAGVQGIPSDSARDLPDVSLTAAAGHDPYLLCVADQGGDCVSNVIVVGGTSASTPSFAAIMALVVQKNGGRVGLANFGLYRLAATETLSQCNGSSTGTTPSGSCIFYDTTVGNNYVPGLPTPQKYQAGTGYDEATGLGSVNVNNLVTKWSSVTFNPTTTTLTLNPKTGITHGQSVQVSATVASKNGGPTPTGDVSLIGVTSSGQIGVDWSNLTAGSATGTTQRLPGGTYPIHAHYSGSSTYGGSDSVPVTVTVNPESSTTAISALTFNFSLNQFVSFSSIAYGDPGSVYLRADVTGAGGSTYPSGYPTGTVTFNNAASQLFQGTLNSGGNTATPNGLFNLTPGNYSVIGSYGGDASFNASTSAPVAFTVTQGPTTNSMQASPSSGVTTSTNVTLTATIGTNSAGNPPTGMVTFFNGTTSLGPAPVSGFPATNTTPAGGTATITTTLPAGNLTLTANYAGDTNYTAAVSGGFPLTVTSPSPSFTLPSSPTQINISSPGQPGSGQIAVTSTNGFAGNVTMSCAVPTTMTGATCSITSPVMLTANSSMNATLNITTQAPHSSSLQMPGWMGASGGVFFAAVLLSGIGSQRRRRKLLIGAFLVVLGAFALSAVGCGGSGSKLTGGTPTGSYTVTVTAVSGTITQTTNVPVNVQ
jgi:hypothetical protein